jgi:hypothetical protein
MKYSDIPKFPSGGAKYEVSLRDFMDGYNPFKKYEREYGLVLCPDFQRGHVWTQDQQIKFMEFVLRGGHMPPIFLNNTALPDDWVGGEFVCVDGLQRVTSLQKFLDGNLPVWGHTCKEIEGKVPRVISISYEIHWIKSRTDLLQWYVDLNSGGTPHSVDEIERVKAMIKGGL